MSKIKKLNGAIVNQIAAGEVVIQPCSVIKELVENSIDAGARKVEVSFEGSGADELKIMDDGAGMDPEDLLLCIEPHATSKISSAEDLYQVVSCGFRGEALASIAEVSKFEIISRSTDSEKAHRLFRANDGSYQTQPASRSQGTTVSMKQLFHNVPVRRRFLKSDRSETSYNLDILRKLALSRPWIGMNVYHDGKTCWELPEDQELEERVKDLGLYDKKCNFLKFEKEDGQVKVSGVVVSPPDHYGNGQKIHLYVNRRPIKDKSLSQALVRAFSSYIPERRFPGGVVFIDMDPEEVDVNIHPTKSEVRFREADVIFKRVYGAVREVLLDSAQDHDAAEQPQTLVYKTSGLAKTVPMNRQYGGVYEGRPAPFGSDAPKGNTGQSPSFKAPTMGHTPLENPFAPRQPEEVSGESNDHGFQESNTQKGQTQEHHTPEESIQSFSVDQLPTAYQIMDRFILIERDDHFELMDQHAIHERILYNQLAHEDRHRKSYASQGLLVPATLDLPPALGTLSEGLLEELNGMGFQLEISNGGEKILVNGLPDFLKIEKGLRILEEMLDDLANDLPPNRDDLRRDILHSAACRSAIKAGDHLTDDELKGIVAASLTMDKHQGCCPHGRNAIWKISVAEANAMFNR